ncbi:MAG: lysine--tRNA ligase [Clostridia bacterium]|nr:lysine--tRNA ligase [Clostridia bacterium]
MQEERLNPEVEEEISEEQLSEQRKIRREKLKTLQDKGINPFLEETWDVTAHSLDIKDNFDAMEEVEVSVAGRVMAFRNMGKASFVDLLDKKGRIQLFVSKDNIGEDYSWFKTTDIGDIIGVTGNVFKTKTGEVSIRVMSIKLLSKSLQVLPNKWHGLKDQDQRYRQRYVDLIINPEVKDTFLKRAKCIKEFRRVLEEDFGYLEVDTPILTTIAGGANARPFNTHHNTLDIDLKLRISNELFLKRCIVGGLDRVYEMGKMFRNEGMDRRHNPEFTNMECYAAYKDMDFTMEVVEQMVYKTQMLVNGTPVIKYQGKEFDVTPPWKRLTMSDAIKEITGVDFDKIDTDEEAREAAIGKGMDPKEVNGWTRGKILAEMFETFCEDVPGYLDGPTFVIGHPVEVSPLAKRDPKDPRITRRFEAYLNGWEIANAFSELNDPIDQYNRFAEQQKQLDLGLDDEAHPMDMDFVNALEVGMPPTGGLGVGIDRVIMLICDVPSIRDIVLFPTMKPEGTKKDKVEGPSLGAVCPSCGDSTLEPIDFSKVQVEPLFSDLVDFETFSKSDFRAVKVKECTAVPKSNKLLKFVLNDGTGTDRVILSGIHPFYEPETLVGKTLLAITNLPPRKMMGIESCGMLLSLIHNEGEDEKLHLIQLDRHIPAGAKLY